MTHLLRALTVALFGLMLAACSPQPGAAGPSFAATDVTGAGYAQALTLDGTDGRPHSLTDFRGKAVVVFFGYTHCPDVCPTTLGDIAGWQEELGDAAKDLRVFFVTVDPERDSVETLREYVSWVPGVIGVSGSPEEIAKAVKAFRIYARKSPLAGGGYNMDHSSMLLLFDRDGEYAGLIGYQEEDARALASLRKLLGS